MSIKLEIGMYCYNKTNRKLGIGKIIGFQSNNNIKVRYKNDIELVSIGNIKASFDIINLIKEGDILLLLDKEYGEKYKAEVVEDSINFKSIINFGQDDLLNLEYELITNEHIELLKILTKEQFESMSYRIGDKE